MEDLTGKQLGQYQVVEGLGEGGMAAVYKAYQAGIDRYVAVKVLPRQHATDPISGEGYIGRFRQEAKIIAKLQHPNILPVFDFGDADGYTFLVMPFIETGTLADLLQGNALPLDQIQRVISQIGDALEHAHSQGLVHRDVKPSNILIDESGNYRLADFGIAKILEGTAAFTATGGLVGTPAYMSPEQGQGLAFDIRCDIYSLGIVLYQLATGRVPYQAETPIAVVFKHIHDPLPLPRSINPLLSESVERVILRALAKSPGDRFASAKDMVAALQSAIHDSEFDHDKAHVEGLAESSRQSYESLTLEGSGLSERRVLVRHGLPWIAFASITIVAAVLLLVGCDEVELCKGAMGMILPSSSQVITKPPGMEAAVATPPSTVIPPESQSSTTDVATETSVTVEAIALSDEHIMWVDEFEGPVLADRWFWLFEDSRHWSLDAVEGSIQIIAQEGSLFGENLSMENLLLTEPPESNFQLITKLTFSPIENFHSAFIICLHDEDNYISLSRRYGNGQQVAFRLEQDGELSVNTTVPLVAETLYLRVDKLMDTYLGFYSLDGEEWTFIDSLEAELSAIHVGLGARAGPSQIEIPATFDYLMVKEP